MLRDLLAIPYNDRRLVVVAEVASLSGKRLFSSKLVESLGILVGGTGILIGAGIVLLAENLRKTKFPGELLPITPDEANQLTFPVGHPRTKVLYVCHPVDRRIYMAVAQFHTSLFEHKVAEALRLIRCLGARTIDIVRVEGWDQSIGINVGLSLPVAELVDISASASRSKASGRYVMSQMKLNPSRDPYVPDGLVWLAHEPLWQEVVEARIDAGLTSFVLDVRSTDDYGVNANLKALITKAGLEAGGSFVEHRQTTWRLEGSFS